eukprot:CAMPEP_0175051630 /NCGR_PEP_ID=MMETSP0052_2-20121109/7917_1 /TAXON_ID=51329 ORGANISM="Polytomella parva, Strain SAG 63-3" /NCGR_SAMPLE_ID=MMETSP0052_2 /ASSEMBLY_ACC=CAM_ASM_000194 /LENGTH=421 /DNA_ID=CAMNT_0016315957 /DNA_START=307 /DNA_END=1572 /DNA_ORIENTATION=-
MSGITLHWSVYDPNSTNNLTTASISSGTFAANQRRNLNGGSSDPYSTPPSNLCTGTTVSSIPDLYTAYNNGGITLHMAMEAVWSQGYVSLSFPRKAGSMASADAIIGWISSTTNLPVVSAYDITSQDVRQSDALSNSWAYGLGVAYNSSSGSTIVCFSRKAKDTRAMVSSNLLANAVPGVNATLSLNFALGKQQGLGDHKQAGGLNLNILTGEVEEVVDEKAVRSHGALMTVAWSVFAPLGAIAPAHRWLFGGPRVMVFGYQLWFVVHVFCQFTSFMLCLASFILAFVKFGDGNGNVYTAHVAVGCIVMALSILQILIAFALRPAPTHRLRRIWNFFHHNVGRLAIILAWTTIYLGIRVYHTSDFKGDMKPWIVANTVMIGFAVLLYAFVSIVSATKSRGGYEAANKDLIPGDRNVEANAQ